MGVSFYRHFVGFFRFDHTSRLDESAWKEVQRCFSKVVNADVHRKVFRCLRGVSHFCCKPHRPLCVHIESDKVGFCLLSIPIHDCILSDILGEINQYVISILLELPFRTEREEDGALLTQLCRSRVKPEVPDLQEICVRAVASSMPHACIDPLPKLCGKAVQEYREKIKTREEMVKNSDYIWQYCQVSLSADEGVCDRGPWLHAVEPVPRSLSPSFNLSDGNA